MEWRRKLAELTGPLELLPPVEFCFAYGSTILINNEDKTSMVDYILGVRDPLQWHQENLERNRVHYSNWMARLGPKALTWVADRIGVGLHFNPFVDCGGKIIKYGVIGMQDMVRDVLTWDRFYLSGRLQKPVNVLIDNWEIQKVNTVNLKASTSVALLLLPAKFTEEELYTKVCSLSYMGDVRMIFAEDKDKVTKIVNGSFNRFRSLYRPILQNCVAEGLIEPFSYSGTEIFAQDFGPSATSSLFHSLPSHIKNRVGAQLGLMRSRGGSLGEQFDGGEAARSIPRTRGEIMGCTQKALRRVVMTSSARQALAGLVATGGLNAARYLGRKMSKAWCSRTT